jgi:Fe-S cluster biogenesis protein NfuA
MVSFQWSNGDVEWHDLQARSVRQRRITVHAASGDPGGVLLNLKSGGSAMRDRVQKVIDRLKPGFDTTEVILLGVKDGIVRVQVFAPGCHGGPPKEATVAILEEELRAEIPEIKEVVAD